MDQFWNSKPPNFSLTYAKTCEHFKQKIRLSEKDEDKIRSRFVTAKETLLPLENQIAFTDQLIDQIVYRLYGLTEGEIKIIEGVN